MSVYSYSTTDILITSKPCKLYSIVLTNTGANDGTVVLYDGQAANLDRVVATVMVGRESTEQFSWKGLKLSRGLYVNLDDKTDMVTVEWENVAVEDE